MNTTTCKNEADEKLVQLLGQVYPDLERRLARLSEGILGFEDMSRHQRYRLRKALHGINRVVSLIDIWVRDEPVLEPFLEAMDHFTVEYEDSPGRAFMHLENRLKNHPSVEMAERLGIHPARVLNSACTCNHLIQKSLGSLEQGLGSIISTMSDDGTQPKSGVRPALEAIFCATQYLRSLQEPLLCDLVSAVDAFFDAICEKHELNTVRLRSDLEALHDGLCAKYGRVVSL